MPEEEGGPYSGVSCQNNHLQALFSFCRYAMLLWNEQKIKWMKHMAVRPDKLESGGE